jgi:hypothetical protein
MGFRKSRLMLFLTKFGTALALSFFTKQLNRSPLALQRDHNRSAVAVAHVHVTITLAKNVKLIMRPLWCTVSCVLFAGKCITTYHGDRHKSHKSTLQYLFHNLSSYVVRIGTFQIP